MKMLWVNGVSELAKPGGMYDTLHAADTAHSLAISLIFWMKQTCSEEQRHDNIDVDVNALVKLSGNCYLTVINDKQ